MRGKCSVAVIDYNTGNIASLLAALRLAGANPFVAKSPEDIIEAEALVLPGVGHFATAVKTLHSSGLYTCILEAVNKGLPTLGICLGFQLLTLGSEEAIGVKGLGFLPLMTKRINPKDKYTNKVPHIGWNSIDSAEGDTRLLHNIPSEKQVFYYSNAYAVKPSASFKTSQAFYNHDSDWLALIEKDNIYGVQFHPEKSRSQGNILFINFLNLNS